MRDNAARGPPRRGARYPHATSMVGEKESSGERRPGKRRVRRWLALACGLPVVLLTCAFLLRDAWLGPLLIRYLRERAREELGAELTIERVSGGWLNDLTLEGVSWKSSRPPLRLVREARVELGYSLRGAWKGAPEPVVRVHARGIEFQLQPRGKGSERGASTLPDVAGVELDLSELVVRQSGREPQRVESLRLRGGLRGGMALVEELELVAGANRVVLRDGSLDLSEADWLALARSARGELVASLPEARFLEEIIGRRFGLRSAELALSTENGRARLTGEVEIDYGRLRVERGELLLPANDDMEELQVDLDLRAELSDLAPVGALLGQTLEGRWSGSIDLEGPLRALVGRFVGRGEALCIAGVSIDLAEIDIETDGDLARLERFELSGPGLEAVVRGGLRLHPLELVDLAMNISADAAPLALLPFPCEHAFLHADLSGPPHSPRGKFEVSARGVELGGFRIDDAAARGEVAAGTLQVAKIRATSGESFVEATGTLRRSGTGFTADLERLGLAWSGTRAELGRGAHLEFGSRRFAVEGLELTSESAAGSGRARIALQHELGTTRAGFDFERYDAGPLLGPFLPQGWKAGRASGHVEGELGGQQDPSGAPSTLELDLALEGWSLSPAWPELDAKLRGGFDGRALDLEHFELGFAADEALHARGTLRVPFDPRAPLALGTGPVVLRSEVETNDLLRSLRRLGLEPGPSTTGPSRVELDLAGSWSGLTGSMAIDAQKITLGDGAGARAWDVEARLGFGERVRIERAVFSAPGDTITLSGEVGVALDVPRLTTDRWALLDAPLDLAVELDLADIGWIAELSDDVRRVSGRVTGRVEIRGTAHEPALGGALAVREGEVRVASPLWPPLRHVAADIAFEDDVVRVVALTGEAGGAPVRVSGTLEPFGPFRRVDLELTGKNLLVRRDSHLVLRVDATLEVKGMPNQLAIRGELALAEGRYTTEISPLEEAVQAGTRRGGSAPRPTHFSIWPRGMLANSEIDVHIGGTRAFEYRTNLLAAALRPDAWLRGTGAFPVLEGPVYLEEASLILPSGTLQLVSGLLTFRREAPLLPELALTAEMRVQRHDVTAKITGQIPPEVALSSSPPMAQEDLWLLVLTGQLPVARGEEQDSQAMEALAVFLARDTLVRWFGAEPGDADLLERFEIEVGAKPSETGQPTGRVLFYLRPRERKSGRATYLSAESDEHDRVNFAIGIVFRPR